MVAYEEWMPPQMPLEERLDYASKYPTNPHLGCAEAWEAWAATRPYDATEQATSVNTGSQTIQYGRHGGGERGAALARADWHRARARVRTARIGPDFAEGAGEGSGVPEPLARAARAAQFAYYQRAQESTWRVM